MVQVRWRSGDGRGRLEVESGKQVGNNKRPGVLGGTGMRMGEGDGDGDGDGRGMRW